MSDEPRYITVEKFRVEVDKTDLPPAEERLTEDGYEEPLVDKIKEAINEVDEVEGVQRIEKG